MNACHLCENACTNPELTSDIDLHFSTIGKCEPHYRILFETGRARPTVINFEVLKGDEMRMVGFYRPRFCPNCGRKLFENEKKKDR